MNSNCARYTTKRSRQVDDEVDMLAARVDEMELIMERFQCMNAQMLDGDESSSDANSPTSYADAVDKAMDIMEGLRNRRSRIQPQAAQGNTGNQAGQSGGSAGRSPHP
ncbi:hypothetical protein F511_16074 [Dorcoceras hygrometricum]|uniref:Uncharacterized protein n=1 Tax=Dorcoceras hygrometricum TaxID=472368 RepID=A0A2Z7BZ19_9LAMI|nr:hypothetical protein F511_16074 [Dorcoceras hygrometricum]